MNKKIKTALTIIISLGFAVFFMGLALGDLDFEKITKSLTEVNYFWVFLSAFFAILAYVFRAIRWNLLLEPIGYQVKKSNAFWSIAFGYMMNLTIPRSGELARATALYGVEKIPVEKSFATIVIERVVDLCFMLLFLFLTFVFNRNVLNLFFNQLTNYQSVEPQQFSSTDEFLLKMGVENLASFYFNVKVGILVIGFLGFLIFFLKFKEKLFNFIKGILEGLLSIFRMRERLKFLLYSSGIWICYFLSAFVICFALAETSTFGIKDGFLILTAGTLGMMVPTSGGAGSFHIAVKLAIAGIFISLGKDAQTGEETGLTYAIISHTMQMISMLIMGLSAIPVLLKNKIK